MMKTAIVTAGLLVLTTPAHADPCEAPLPKRGEVFSGKVAYVGDGDSLCVTSPAGLIEVRLADYYAPELHDAGGLEAKRALSRIAMGKRVTCQAENRSYDRIVAACDLNGSSLGDLMRSRVAQGGRGWKGYGNR